MTKKQRSMREPITQRQADLTYTIRFQELEFIFELYPYTLEITYYISDQGDHVKTKIGRYHFKNKRFQYNFRELSFLPPSVATSVNNWIMSPDSRIRPYFHPPRKRKSKNDLIADKLERREKSRIYRDTVNARLDYSCVEQRNAMRQRVKARKAAKLAAIA